LGNCHFKQRFNETISDDNDRFDALFGDRKLDPNTAFVACYLKGIEPSIRNHLLGEPMFKNCSQDTTLLDKVYNVAANCKTQNLTTDPLTIIYILSKRTSRTELRAA
jgi:hypothetical protein